MFLHVISVTYLGDYRLRLEFNDGRVKDVDLKDELYGEIFEPLKEIELFKQVAVNLDTNTIEWPNGADFAPEFLYEIGQESFKTHELDVLLRLWGAEPIMKKKYLNAWSDVAGWNPEIRYNLVGSTSLQEARAMIAASKFLLREL